MIEHWLILLAVGLVTFSYRWSCIGWFAQRDIQQSWMHLLRFVPPAAFAALVSPELVLRNGVLISSATDPRLLAGVAAALVAWKMRNVLLTISTGMIVLHALQ